MLPKEEKPHPNKLMNRLIKKSQGKGNPRNVPNPNSSFGYLSSPTDQVYLIPRIAKEKLKPIDTEGKTRNRIYTTHLKSEKSQQDLHNSEKVIAMERSRHLNPLTLSKGRSRVYSNIDESMVMDREF